MFARTGPGLLIVAGLVLGACAGEEEERLDVFTDCVNAGGGTVGDDAHLAFDEFGNALAIVGESDIDPALLRTCLEAASAPLES